eukprot:3298653-Pyramimonas_sp.AAC.1
MTWEVQSGPKPAERGQHKGGAPPVQLRARAEHSAGWSGWATRQRCAPGTRPAPRRAATRG